MAQGTAPADLVLANARVMHLVTGEILPGDIAIVDGVIAAIGHYPDARERIDLGGRVVAPSLIDAHIHIESSLLWVPEFARAVVPHGTGAVVTDPHEIANVAGVAGIAAIREAAVGLPLHIRFTAPSCVPASRHESPGAVISPEDIAAMLAWPETVGLGELMDFPGVLAGDGLIAAKLAASAGHLRDGHAPHLRGVDLQAYFGSGPTSDHESTTAAEAIEKLRAGAMLMIREGSTEHNLSALLPVVNDRTFSRCCFASDDRDGHTLLHDGHIDAILRSAIAQGLDPMRAYAMATWNAANYWRLEGIGLVAPGYEANLIVLDDVETVDIAMTIFRGKVVAKDGRYVATDTPILPPPDWLRHTVRPAPVMLRDLRLKVEDAGLAVGTIAGQIVTRLLEVEPAVRDGYAVADPSRDLLKLVCVERHHATGRIGVGYVQGFGLARGAIASTIAHDAHNIVAVGVDDTDILGAIAIVAESQGGLAAVADGQILGHLPLPIAGLLSDQPLETLAAEYDALEQIARSLGSTLPSPFGLLAFMALSVIPEVRVTDRGLLRVGVPS